jgi:hypothetical protein
MQSLCLNSAVNSFNRKLKKLVKAHHHASILEITNVRNLFTNHGLHLNGQGKDRLTNHTVSHIYSILEWRDDSPIILNWKEEQKLEGTNTVNDTLEQQKDPVNINCEEEINTNTSVLSTPGKKCGETPEVTAVAHIQNNDEGTATQPQHAKRQRKDPAQRDQYFYGICEAHIE